MWAAPVSIPPVRIAQHKPVPSRQGPMVQSISLQQRARANRIPFPTNLSSPVFPRVGPGIPGWKSGFGARSVRARVMRCLYDASFLSKISPPAGTGDVNGDRDRSLETGTKILCTVNMWFRASVPAPSPRERHASRSSTTKTGGNPDANIPPQAIDRRRRLDIGAGLSTRAPGGAATRPGQGSCPASARSGRTCALLTIEWGQPGSPARGSTQPMSVI